MTETEGVRLWHTIALEEAKHLQLPAAGVIGPVNEMGEECPWPWEPQQLVGAPVGQYHCGYCGAMVVAGMPHLDYREFLSPDCEVAKHDACSGDAWNHITDQPTPCTCVCHAGGQP